MKDIEWPPLPDPKYIWHDADEPGEAELFEFEFSGAVDGRCDICERLYSGEQMSAYARAAVEADRAQRVPDVDALSNFIREIDGAHRFGAGALAERICEWLASTPAPAQQPTTSVPRMTARRAAYFMERFLHEEKMLGPNEQDALTFTIEALEAMATAHQEPPQQERKPMTDAQAVKCIEAAGFKTWTSAHFRLVRQAERHHGIKE